MFKENCSGLFFNVSQVTMNKGLTVDSSGRSICLVCGSFATVRNCHHRRTRLGSLRKYDGNGNDDARKQ